MAGQDLTIMKAMLRQMDWNEARQKTMAQNIANADTPHYQPVDLKPVSFKDLMRSSSSGMAMSSGVSTTTTNAKHMDVGTSSISGPNVKSGKQKNTYETSPSGNAVVIEEQLLKMNETAAEHMMLSNLYEKNMKMLKDAAKQ